MARRQLPRGLRDEDFNKLCTIAEEIIAKYPINATKIALQTAKARNVAAKALPADAKHAWTGQFVCLPHRVLHCIECPPEAHVIPYVPELHKFGPSDASEGPKWPDGTPDFGCEHGNLPSCARCQADFVSVAPVR